MHILLKILIKLNVVVLYLLFSASIYYAYISLNHCYKKIFVHKRQKLLCLSTDLAKNVATYYLISLYKPLFLLLINKNLLYYIFVKLYWFCVLNNVDTIVKAIFKKFKI